MLDILLARWRQKYRTIAYPSAPPVLPDRLRGLPLLAPEKCPPGCAACRASCPTDAIAADEHGFHVDLGRCLFCTACSTACPTGAVRYTPEHRLAARTRAELIVHGTEGPRVRALDEQLRKLYGRSLKLRQVSAGGCNACEADVNVLGTIGFDLGRFGIQMVASPRHADGLLITGPVSDNMRRALQKTYEAVPPPRIVIAVGACAISGGPYVDHPEVHNGADAVVPVDLYIPGCPPHPITMLDGLLRLLGRIADERGAAAR